MSSDWVKMRTDLYSHPKVIWIADNLFDPEGIFAKHIELFMGQPMVVTRDITRHLTVGALVTLWGKVRHLGKRQGDDLILSCAQLFTIDYITHLRGFGAAMSDVGWAIQQDDSLIFPKFFEDLNHDPLAEKNAKHAESQRRYRDRKRTITRDVTVTSQSDTEKRRVEKRKEEKSNTISVSKPERAPGVFLTDAEHEKFVTDFGPEFVARCCEKLSAWIEQDPTPKRKRNGRNAAATFRAWVLNAVSEEQVRASRLQRSAPVNGFVNKAQAVQDSNIAAMQAFIAGGKEDA